MVKIRTTDFFGTKVDQIDDVEFTLPVMVENKLNIYALKNDGYGFVFNSIPMMSDLPIKMSIKLLSKERFITRTKDAVDGKPYLLYVAENDLQVIIEEEILELIENSILDWDKLLVLYGIQ